MRSEASSASSSLLAASAIGSAKSVVSTTKVAIYSTIDHIIDIITAYCTTGRRAEERRPENSRREVDSAGSRATTSTDSSRSYLLSRSTHWSAYSVGDGTSGKESRDTRYTSAEREVATHS